MDWHISIPYRHRDEGVVDVLANCRHLGPDADVTREIVAKLRVDVGLNSAGELIDALGRLEPAHRRVLLGQARTACGLEETAMVDARRRISNTRPLGEMRRREDTWSYYEPSDGPRIGIGPGGIPTDIDAAAAEAARQAEAEESGKRQLDQRLAACQHEAEAMAAHESALREQTRRELPEHLRGSVP